MASLVLIRSGHSVGRHDIREVSTSSARCRNLPAATALILRTTDILNVHVAHKLLDILDVCHIVLAVAMIGVTGVLVLLLCILDESLCTIGSNNLLGHLLWLMLDTILIAIELDRVITARVMVMVVFCRTTYHPPSRMLLAIEVRRRYLLDVYLGRHLDLLDRRLDLLK